MSWVLLYVLGFVICPGSCYMSCILQKLITLNRCCSEKGCGVAWRGVAWRGVAWRGVAWRGVAWRGVAWRGVAWRGVAWRGVAWRGVAWRGVAWRGVAWRGVAWRGGQFVGIMPSEYHNPTKVDILASVTRKNYLFSHVTPGALI